MFFGFMNFLSNRLRGDIIKIIESKKYKYFNYVWFFLIVLSVLILGYIVTRFNFHEWVSLLIMYLWCLFFILIILTISTSPIDKVNNFIDKQEQILFQRNLTRTGESGRPGLGKIYLTDKKIIYIPSVSSTNRNNDKIYILDNNKIEYIFLINNTNYFYISMEDKTLKFHIKESYKNEFKSAIEKISVRLDIDDTLDYKDQILLRNMS
jgi:hypothetical protein